MRVIFLKDVPRVGRKNDVKDISDGYATNFLFPRKLAEMATPNTLAQLEKRQKEVLVSKQVQNDLLERNLEELKNKIIHIKSKANEKGSLFSSIHKKEIIEAMKKEHNSEIGEEFIILEKPIKEIGEFTIPVEIQNKKTSFKLIIEKI